jgi:multiple sugar transport system substrate-binding protein
MKQSRPASGGEFRCSLELKREDDAMPRVNRRTFTQLSGLSLASAVAAGRGRPVAAQDKDITLQWWDHYAPLEAILQENFDAYTAEHPNVTVERTLYNLPELGQSLQLAFNSDQAPDVHAIASLNVPTPALVQEGWFTPIGDHVSDEFMARFPEGAILEGLHSFDGQLYSFPMFSFRSSSSALWFNKQLVEEAEIDPEVGPQTWDEFRQACATITENGGGRAYGWIQAIMLADRLGTQVSELSQLAGGPGTLDWTTGEYSYHSQEILDTIEFLYSIHQDGNMFPASTSLDAREARARFSTGVAGFNFDGPWSIGVINNDYAEFADLVGVAQTPVPDLASAGYITRGPVGGDFWVNSQSAHPDVAAGILEKFNTPEFYVRLAEQMDQPPLDLSAVEQADVHDAYRKALGLYEENIRLGPVPEIRNPDVIDVYANMTDIRPNFGEIVQGVFSGDIEDYATELKAFSDKMTAERDKAIQIVNDAGGSVSVDDWVFDNWEVGTDYTSEFYSS